MPITKREADDLRRVVKSRFEVLHDQVRQRKTEVANRVQETIVAEHQKDLDAAQAKLDVLRKRIAKLNVEAKKVLEDVEREFEGKVAIERGYSRSYDHSDTAWISALAGASVQVPNLMVQVHERTNMITEAAGLATLNLRHQEVLFLEKLTLGGIETADAKAFFDSLPVVDEYLPLPSVKQIKALTP